MHILLISEQDIDKLEALQHVLDRADISLDRISYLDPVQFFNGKEPDVVLLDLSGRTARSEALSLTASVRRDRAIPILGLFPRQGFEGLEASLGLDDFVLVPFDAHELLARVNILVGMRRVGSEESLIRHGDLLVDVVKYEVWVGNREVTLTFKEYQLLLLLASNPGRVFSRESLLTRIWGYDYFGGMRTVDVHITRLRSKLEDPSHSFVETVRNVGYRIGSN